MTYLEESQAAGRHLFPDLARAFALIGIALVNVGAIAYTMDLSYTADALAAPIDSAAYFGVNALFLMKSYTLFSFMFGVGFAFQMQSAERSGAKFSGRYWRRIIGLLVFGLINVAFLFAGDILVIYAILGSIIFLFRNASTKALTTWAIWLYVLKFVLIALLAGLMVLGATFDPEGFAAENDLMFENAVNAAAIFGDGTFTQSIARRFQDWSMVVTFGILIQGIGALSFFLFGFAAVRHGTISNPFAPIWKKFRWRALPIGLIISAAGAYQMMGATSMMDPNMMIGIALITLGSPFSTAGYLGLIAKWSTSPDGPIKTFLARGGTASLTAYLMQGLLLSLVFNAYGLGFFGELGATTCIAIAFGVALFTIAFASLWRTKFKRGPLEHILRTWTYLGSR